MIKSIRHKGLKLYYETNNGTKLPSVQLAKIRRILTVLNAVSDTDDITALGMGIHLLKGQYKGFWALSVTGNFRIIFKFKNPDIFEVDYIDYH